MNTEAIEKAAIHIERCNDLNEKNRNVVIPSYVYDNVEVVKTGRRAARTLRSNKIDELIEIQPKDSNSGEWKKWVREEELYLVKAK